jgi:hypothetical protein
MVASKTEANKVDKQEGHAHGKFLWVMSGGIEGQAFCEDERLALAIIELRGAEAARVYSAF